MEIVLPLCDMGCLKCLNEVRIELKMVSKEFTFMVLSYNQEDYILQHLESVKYQVEKYGKDWDVYLLVCDDASSDSTVLLVKEWLKINKGLFKGVNFNINNYNQGAVKNILCGLESIKTEKFKLLAADDLYLWNNVFEAVKDEDILLSPVISFGEDLRVKLNDINLDFYIYCYQYRNYRKLRKKIGRTLKYSNNINAPGVFLTRHLISDSTFFDLVSNYKIIEDLPMWQYIFRKSNKDYRVRISLKPYILYRVGSGVSTDLSPSKRRKEYDDEKTKIIKDFSVEKIRLGSKWTNPYVYIYHLMYKFYHHWFEREEFSIKWVKDENMQNEMNNYLFYINNRAMEIKDGRTRT